MSVMNVEFKVKINELLQKNEKVFVCGSLEELGNWYPMKSKELKRQECSKVNKTEIWSTQMMLPLSDINYRYFIGSTDDNYESSDERTVNITTWESNVKPRTKLILEHINNGRQKKTALIDIYGYIDDHCRLLKGWLTDQTAVQIRIYGDPIKFYKTRHKSKRVFLNCHYYQMEKGHWNNDDEDENMNGVQHQVAKFSKLTEENFTPALPPFQGVEFGGEYLIFYLETMDLEDTWIEIEIRQLKCDLSSSQTGSSRIINDLDGGVCSRQPIVAENGNLDQYVLVGTARLGLMPSEKSIKSVSIFNAQNRPIGEIMIEFIAIYPLMGLRYTMEETFQLHWKHRKTLNVGHRGTGSSYGGATKVSAVRENTLFSLRTALDHGADYVEFDVQLSKDMIPVLYHDFQVCTVLRKKRKNDLQYLEIPVKDLTLADMEALKLDPTCMMLDDERNEKMNMEDIDPHELQPFPTLQICLEEIPVHLGFNIELKYPQTYENGKSEQSNYFDRNVYVDTILKVISKYARTRRIIFSCFDADICLMATLKQNKYPVFFLTQGDTEVYEQFKDYRAKSLENAMYFAKSVNILGLSVFSSIVFDNLSIIQTILNKKLILFIWGEDINSTEAMDHWRKIGVHGIIFDRIHEFHQSGSMNIFHLPNVDTALSQMSNSQDSLQA